LDGKKVALWLSATQDQVYAGKGAELYDLLAKMLKEKFADIKIVPYADLPMKFAPENEVVTAIAAAKPDAVVAAFGG
jgi:UDP-N-acetyl-D-mannosaminuronic acid transferase (WecB/TagA/CpsF family)